jgi:hypothetical protein
MTSNELAPEKCIADDPPVPSLAELESSDNVVLIGDPPSMRLLFEGLRHHEITAEFLVDLHQVADDHHLNVDGISVRQPDPGERDHERL